MLLDQNRAEAPFKQMPSPAVLAVKPLRIRAVQSVKEEWGQPCAPCAHSREYLAQAR